MFTLLFVLGLATGFAARCYAEPRVIWEGDFSEADASDPGSWGWAEIPGIYNRQGRAPTHAMRQTADGQVLVVGVPSTAKLELTREIAVNPGKVYRVEFTGRMDGQIESLEARGMLEQNRSLRLKLPVSLEYRTYTLQTLADPRDKELTLRLDFSGVGEFLMRDFRITELDEFDLPAVERAPRGEMLPNPDFSMGSVGWTMFDGQRHTSPLEERRPQDAVTEGLRVDPETGRVGMHLQTGRKVRRVFSQTLLPLVYGRSYHITVEGEAFDRDVELFLARTGSVWTSRVFKLNLEFRDGVAEAVYRHEAANHIVTGPEDRVVLLLQHRGRGLARIERVSIQESESGRPEAITPRPVFAVELDAEVGGRDRIVNPGETVTARLTTRWVNSDTPLQLQVIDERRKIVATQAVPAGTLQVSDDGVGRGEVDLPELPVGWYQVSVRPKDADAADIICDDLAVVYPADPAMERNDYLGIHIGTTTYRDQIRAFAELGFTQVRGYNAGWEWYLQQAEKGGSLDLSSPMAQLDFYESLGMEVMVVLQGTPLWTSTYQEDDPRSDWLIEHKHPPDDMAHWDRYVREVVTAFGDRVNAYEVWNEPNGHFLKKAPSDTRSYEELYGELLRRASRQIRAVNPEATVCFGGPAGGGGFAIRTLRQYPDLINDIDEIAYHAYLEIYIANEGVAGFTRQASLREFLDEINQSDMPVVDSESGFHKTLDGPEGVAHGMLMAKGLVTRPAAGIERFYLYKGDDRVFPGQANINNVFGLNGRPLVMAPVYAAFDRILGNADMSSVEILGDESAGHHVYRFSRNDGHQVIVAWNSVPDAPRQLPQSLIPQTVAVDYLGRRLESGPDVGKLDNDLRYFVPAELWRQIVTRVSR